MVSEVDWGNRRIKSLKESFETSKDEHSERKLLKPEWNEMGLKACEEGACIWQTKQLRDDYNEIITYRANYWNVWAKMCKCSRQKMGNNDKWPCWMLDAEWGKLMKNVKVLESKNHRTSEKTSWWFQFHDHVSHAWRQNGFRKPIPKTKSKNRLLSFAIFNGIN